MSEIVDALRYWGKSVTLGANQGARSTFTDAADRIEQLEAELARVTEERDRLNEELKTLLEDTNYP